MALKATVAKDTAWDNVKATPTEIADAKEKMLQTITFKVGNFDDEKRTFTAVGSTAVVDRMGEVIDQAGWDLENFIQNPVIPWCHDYYELPVARAIEVGVENGVLKFVYQAPPEGMYEFADTVWNFYRSQYMFAFSVGFIPKQMENNTFTECELLEISAVVVPANPQALALAYKSGDLDAKHAKTLIKKMDESMKFLKEAVAKDVTDEDIKEEVVDAKEDAHTTTSKNDEAVAADVTGSDANKEAETTSNKETNNQDENNESEEKSQKTLTEDDNMAQNNDMSETTKSGAKLSAQTREKLQTIHDGLKGLVADAAGHMKALSDLLEVGTDGENGTDEPVSKPNNDDSENKSVDDAKAKDVQDENSNAEVKNDNSKADENADDTKSTDADKQESADTNSDDNSNEGAKQEDNKDKDKDADSSSINDQEVDPENLTDEQAAEVVRAVNEALKAN